MCVWIYGQARLHSVSCRNVYPRQECITATSFSIGFRFRPVKSAVAIESSVWDDWGHLGVIPHLVWGVSYKFNFLMVSTTDCSLKYEVCSPVSECRNVLTWPAFRVRSRIQERGIYIQYCFRLYAVILGVYHYESWPPGSSPSWIRPLLDPPCSTPGSQCLSRVLLHNADPLLLSAEIREADIGIEAWGKYLNYF